MVILTFRLYIYSRGENKGDAILLADTKKDFIVGGKQAVKVVMKNIDCLHYSLDIIGFFVILPVFVQLMNFTGNITLLL